MDNERDEEWALPMSHAGWYAWRQGLFVQAEEMVAIALKIHEGLFGRDDTRTL